MVTRVLTVLFVLVLTGLAPRQAVPAQAQQYQGCQATVSDITVTPGQTITVTGSGAEPGATVTAAIGDRTVGTGTADANGNFSFPATIPADLAPGTNTLTVSCGNGGVARMTIEVGLTDAGGGPVAETGSNTTIPFIRLGIAAIAAGGLILAVSRRRAAGARAR